MPTIVNPFDAGGFTLADMTRAIQLIPNMYGRLNLMNLFPAEPLSQRTAIVEMSEGTLRLLPQKPVGGPATMGTTDKRKVRSFVVPHIPHNDVVLPEEVQGIRGFGLTNTQEALSTLMARKLLRMRQRHSQTLEYMRVKALSGITKDGTGETVYDWYHEFGIERTAVDFHLNQDTDMLQHCREISRHMEENLHGESMSRILALVSPEFFDRLIQHPSVKEAYKYFQSTNGGGNPLRDDVRAGFPFGSIVFQEYLGTVTLSNGKTDTLLTPGEGVAFPLGTMDTFSTFFAPSNFMEDVGAFGQELYAKQLLRPDDTGIDILTQSNPLPIVKRPALCVRLFSSK